MSHLLCNVLLSDSYVCRGCTEDVTLPPRCDGLFVQGVIPPAIAQHCIPLTGCLTQDPDTQIVYCVLLLRSDMCYGCDLRYHALDPCHWRTSKNIKGCQHHDSVTSAYVHMETLERALSAQQCYGCALKEPLYEKSHYHTTLNKYGCRRFAQTDVSTAAKPRPLNYPTATVV